MNALFVQVGLLALIASIAGAIVWSLLERRKLGQLVEGLIAISHAGKPVAHGKGPAQSMPAAWRQAAVTFQHALTSQDLDTKTCQAIAEVSRASFRLPLAAGLLMDLLLATIAVLPAASGLIRASRRLSDLWETARTLKPPKLYSTILDVAPAVFTELAPTFAGSAILLAGVIVFWTVRWTFLRPALREARVHQAFLRVLAEGSFRRRAPKTSQLANLVAPDPSLRPAVRAAIVFVVITSVGWSLLTVFAPFRARNQSSLPVSAMWPERRVTASQKSGLSVPTYAAGNPFDTVGPSLIVSPNAVHIASVQLVPLTNGELPANWPEGAQNVGDILEDFRDNRGGLEVLVLADRGVTLRALAEVLTHLSRKYFVQRFHLVVDRKLPGGNVQASMPLELRKDVDGMLLTLDALTVTSSAGQASARFEGESWRSDLRSSVWRSLGLFEPNADPESNKVTVAARPNLTYDRLLEVIAAVDSMCDESQDCGVPGVGLRFVLKLPLLEE